MTGQPLVSAITIFLNGEQFIREAIESVLSQTYRNWELLLVDDGSTDGSSAIAFEYARRYPEKIRYIEHEGHQNRGMSASRNAGIRHARGKYVALLDADDVWLPLKFERQVAFMEAHPDVGMLCGRTEYWHSWTGLPADLERDRVPEHGLGQQILFDPPSLLSRVYPLGLGTAPCLCSLLIRADALARVGGFEESFRGFYEDQGFLTKMYFGERIALSDECWDRYRIHPASCSAVVRDSGRYDAHRGRFLHWLRTCLETKSHVPLEVRNALTDALRPYQPDSTVAPGEGKWLRLLRVAEGNAARLESTVDNPDLVRVAITTVATEARYDIQLNLPRLCLSSNHRYAVGFLARADVPRTIGVGCAQGHAPWTNLGLYSEVQVAREWQPYELTFAATGDEDNARIHFDVGGSSVSVEIAAVAVRNLSEASFVRPAVAAPRVGAQSSSMAPLEPPVEIGKIDFGSFRRVTPISEDFGCDRGRPIDRHYIEKFLASCAGDIQGHVLEIGDNTYTRRYGGSRVVKSDVLHVVEGEPQATIIADLSSADHIPSDTFDCVILTQTLQLIYDFRAALRTIYRILKPGGILLATFPGISQSYDSEWGECWYWNFTGVSARRFLDEVFPPSGVAIETFGNVLAAVSFLHGVAVEELTTEELDYRDSGYDVTIAVRARKPSESATEKKTSAHLSSVSATGDAQGRAAILMYHRVTDTSSDPWKLCVSPEHFAEQMEVLQRHANAIPLRDLLPSLNRGSLPPRAVALTFDDGYADNLLNAKPVLERFGLPATVFVTTGCLDGGREFWWDELERLVLSPGDLPRSLELTIDGRMYRWELDDAAVYSDADCQRDRDWKAPDNPPTRRHALFVSLWRVLQLLPDREQRHSLDRVRDWAGAAREVRASHRALVPEEVIALISGGTIEIGAHTITHPILGDLPSSARHEELRGSKTMLEELLGGPVTSFAYPYGAHTLDVVSDVRAAGFDRACCTVTGMVKRGSDSFRLPRIEVMDWDGDEFHRHLSKCWSEIG